MADEYGTLVEAIELSNMRREALRCARAHEPFGEDGKVIKNIQAVASLLKEEVHIEFEDGTRIDRVVRLPESIMYSHDA